VTSAGAILTLPQLAQVEIRERTGEGCVAENGFCPGWIAENIDKYWSPLLEHVFLVVVSVGVGFAIAFSLALAAHRQRWLTGPIIGVTGALYTVPSVAAFFLLLPITGRGNLTAIVALVAYTLLILFRNITTGLRNVPEDVRDAARGMGLTDGQILRRVELPLAMPEILAGVRIAFTTTVGLATLAFFAGGGGLGEQIYSEKAGTGGIFFRSNVVVAGGLAVLLAAFGDLLVLGFQRLMAPWRRAAHA
jgi:osmoprotectant transport system permease protein